LMALVWPTTTLPKYTDAGDTAVGAMPVPVSATVSGLLGALVVIVKEVAATGPATAGASVNRMLQLEPAASVLPHVPPEME